MQKRVLRAARKGRAMLRKGWADYLQTSVPFSPQLNLTRRPRSNLAAIAKARSFADLDSFCSAHIQPGISAVWHRGLPIDLSLSINRGKPLTVVFHGAANIDVRLPFLSGAGVTGSLDSSRLSISDPSLYLDPKLNLAWFSGSHAQPDLIVALVRLIKKVADAAGASRIVLFGGSGGGYISLRLLEHFRHATAVVMNPQTDIEKYHEMHVQKYVDLAWRGDRDLLRSTSGTTVFNSVEAARDTAKVIYLQNSNDSFHIAAHLAPFLEHFSGTENFFLLQDSWRDGHTPPPKEKIQEILSAAIAGDGPALTGRLNFTQL